MIKIVTSFPLQNQFYFICCYLCECSFDWGEKHWWEFCIVAVHETASHWRHLLPSCRPQPLLHFKSPCPALPHIPMDFTTFVSLWRENSGTESSRSGMHSQYHLLIWSHFSQIIWTVQLQTKIPSEFMLLDMLTLVLILQIGWLIGWGAFKWKRNNLFHYDSWNNSTCACLPVSCSYCWFVFMVLGMSFPHFPSQPSRFRA